MPTEITLSDGTRFEIPQEPHEVMNVIPYPQQATGWQLFVEEGEPQRWFNPRHVVQVREAAVMPFVEETSY